MPTVVDDITLDPAEFSPGRSELDLSGVGLKVVEANFGESTVEAAMLKRELGEETVDEHLPNKEIILKMEVRREGETDLATVAEQLQAKIGTFQREGGWLRRDFKVGGNFASLACRITKKVTLVDFGNWQKGDSPDVTLALVAGPVWYATLEVNSEEFTEESARELIFELAEVAGTHPGLIRIRIKNEGESDWRGLILAGESRDHPQDETADSTAALAFDAVDLTLLGETKEAEREGVKVARHNNLPNTWLSILDSEIDGVGHWTHKGVRRVWARIWDPGDEIGLVQLRLEWRALGTMEWSRNAIVSTPLVGGWALVDLGECRPSAATLGNERWQVRIAVRTTGPVGADIDIQKVLPLPAEQYAVVRQSLEIDVPTSLNVRDYFSQAEGNATGKSAEVGGTYEALTNSDTTDFTIADGKLKRTAVSDSGTFTGALRGRGIGTPAEMTNLVFRNTFRISGSFEALYFGHIMSYVNASNFIAAFLVFYSKSPQKWRLQFYAPGLVLPVIPLPHLPTSGEFEGELVSVVDGTNLSVFGASGGEPLRRYADITNAKAGVKGKCYLFDMNDAAGAATREYGDLAIWEPDLAVVCSAGRSIELRSEGIFRQHPTEDIWGRVIPEHGFYPQAAPSGLEGRASRYIVIPSQGDLAALPDSGSNPLSAQAHPRGGFHFSREAS